MDRISKESKLVTFESSESVSNLASMHDAVNCAWRTWIWHLRATNKVAYPGCLYPGYGHIAVHGKDMEGIWMMVWAKSWIWGADILGCDKDLVEIWRAIQTCRDGHLKQLNEAHIISLRPKRLQVS